MATTARMTEAIETFDRVASAQAASLIVLTTRLLRWTWALGAIAVLQLAAMLWDIFGAKGGV